MANQCVLRGSLLCHALAKVHMLVSNTTWLLQVCLMRSRQCGGQTSGSISCDTFSHAGALGIGVEHSSRAAS